MASIFHTIFYQPILNALIGIYGAFPIRDLGVAIIILTILVRVALYPLSRNAFRSQMALREIQPKIRAIQKQHRHDPQRATREIMEVYRAHGVSPFGSFLPILVQLPVLIALYRVLLTVLARTPEAFAADLYPFVSHPAELTPYGFAGTVNLTGRSSALAVLAGAAQFVQSTIAWKSAPVPSSGKNDFASAMSLQMRFLLPLFTVFIVRLLPAGVALYWFVTTVFSIVQQLLLMRRTSPLPASDDVGSVSPSAP